MSYGVFELMQCFRVVHLSLPHPQLMYPPDHPQKCHNACRAEPVRLVPSRRNHEVQRRAFFVPDTAVIAGNHVKLVVLRREVRVLHVANVYQEYRPKLRRSWLNTPPTIS